MNITKHIFTVAWMASKVAARKFGGSPKEYFAQALKNEWANHTKKSASCTPKDIVGILDAAADRASQISQRPATSKQTWFLSKLLCEKESDPMAAAMGFGVLTIREASSAIDFALNG
ncbi:hypothetical protein [Kiloniella litopenaei]|uniref:hypothetical protein n=1 Tax=Kiloniella litopenaei TaxID=1549748 RepID=UPI003BAAA700